MKQPKFEEQEVMPSFFKSANSSESHPITSWESLEKFIKENPELKAMTETYRKRLAISKEYADEMKPFSPAVTVSAMMDGYGRKLENIVKPTHILMLDFDHVSKEDMERCIKLARLCEYVFAEYITFSGKGFRLFVKYAPLDDDDVSAMELFNVVVKKAMKYFTDLLGIEPDKVCTDITRCSGLAYDPDAFFRKDAVPMELGLPDLKLLYTQMTIEAKRAKRAAKAKQAKKPSSPAAKGMGDGDALSIEEAAGSIRKLLSDWGYVFESGRHNEYVCHFGKVCVFYGIDKADALKYADREFGSEYADTASVIKSCYKHTDKWGTWHFYREGEGYGGKTSLKAIKQWLTTRYEFHHNEVTGFYELRSLMVLTGKYPHWTCIDDTIENSLWSEMNESGLSVSIKTLHNVINSDFSEPFDPLEDYLRGLKEWHPGKDPDYIDELASRIEVEEIPEYHHTQEWFRYFFKKWLVAMVVAWCCPKVVNQSVFILVGKGGLFKTTFFAWFLPPQLRQYFINDSTGSYTDKDCMEAFSSKALVCLDEFESVFGKALSAFKSNITKLTFSIRRPYDKYRSELPHRASVCGTTNSLQFITDEENRRYSPWLVKSITSPIEVPIDYDHVFAQALALGKEVMSHKKGEQQDWTYWLTPDDIDVMRQHNRLFMVANYAEEQILRFYKVPTEDTDKRFIKFRYSAEILEKIGVSPALRQNLNNQNIGLVMSRLGFQKVHREHGNGWAVIEKDGAEINTDSML